MIGGASAGKKKVVKRANSAGVVLDSKKNRGRNKRKKADVGVGTVSSSKGTSGYSFWRDPRSYSEAVLVSSALGFGGSAIYYRQRDNLYKRFMGELGSFYFRFFGCKSVEELCSAIDRYAKSKLTFYEVDLPASQSFFSLDPFEGTELSKFRDLFSDGVSGSSGVLSIGTIFVDVRKGESILDVASRWLFYDSLIDCCRSCNLVSCKSNYRAYKSGSEFGFGSVTIGEKTLGGIREEFKVSGKTWEEFVESEFKSCDLFLYADQIKDAIDAEELKPLVIKGKEAGMPVNLEVAVGEKSLLDFLESYALVDNVDKKLANMVRIEQKFNLCKEFEREFRDRIERLEKQTKKH